MNRPKVKLQEQYTTVNGWTMLARVGREDYLDNAPIIILVHGLVLSSRYMIPTAEVLAANYPVYVPDLPGYGQSDKPEHVLELPELADILCRWMDAVGIERAIMLGNSFGCQIIVEFALRHPHRLEKAILQGPTIDRHARSLAQQLGRFLKDAPFEDFSQAPIQVQDYWLAGLPRAIRTIQIAFLDRIEAKLPYVRVPTLVVRGENDPVVPQNWAEEVVSLLPQGQLSVIPKGAHTLNYSHPVELSEAVARFLKNNF